MPPKQTLEPPQTLKNPQSLGPQCRAPVILPSIGGDDDYDDIWFGQRTKIGEMVRFFCSRLPAALCSVQDRPVLPSPLPPGDYHHAFDHAFDDDGEFDDDFYDSVILMMLLILMMILMVLMTIVVTLLTIIRSGLRVAMVMLSKTLDLRDNVTCQVLLMFYARCC